MSNGKGYVLVVDDTRSNLEILQQGLGIYGYTVKTLMNGELITTVLNEHVPDLILLDILMPGIDGIELCRWIKKDPRLRDVPVMFLSSVHETVDKVKGFEAGGVDYITRPFEMEEVLARVETHLTLYRQRKQIEYLLQQQEEAEEAERQQRMMLNALLESAIALSSTLDLDDVLKRILQNVQQVVPHEVALVILVESDVGQVVSFRSQHIKNFAANKPFFPVKDIDMIQLVRETRRPYVVYDTQTDPLWIEVPENAAFRSAVCAPLFSGDEFLGCLALLALPSGAYNERTSNQLQTFTLLTGLAITNAKLYRQGQELSVVQEQQRLARELHDSVTQTLFSASTMAEALKLMDYNTEKSRHYIADVSEMTRRAMIEMRSLLFELRPEMLAKTDLTLLLKQQCDLFSLKTQIPVNFTSAGTVMVPEAVHFTFYRIAQEALNNIRKHAAATQVSLSLMAQAHSLDLSISDTGQGFDLDKVNSDKFGLTIMRERAHQINAQLSIHSQIGQGTTILLRFPR